MAVFPVTLKSGGVKDFENKGLSVGLGAFGAFTIIRCNYVFNLFEKSHLKLPPRPPPPLLAKFLQ